jgi:hypothetical protein
MSSNTVPLAVGELLGGRYRIERELGTLKTRRFLFR